MYFVYPNIPTQISFLLHCIRTIIDISQKIQLEIYHLHPIHPRKQESIPFPLTEWSSQMSQMIQAKDPQMVQIVHKILVVKKVCKFNRCDTTPVILFLTIIVIIIIMSVNIRSTAIEDKCDIHNYRRRVRITKK